MDLEHQIDHIIEQNAVLKAIAGSKNSSDLSDGIRAIVISGIVLAGFGVLALTKNVDEKITKSKSEITKTDTETEQELGTITSMNR